MEPSTPLLLFSLQHTHTQSHTHTHIHLCICTCTCTHTNSSSSLISYLLTCFLYIGIEGLRAFITCCHFTYVTPSQVLNTPLPCICTCTGLHVRCMSHLCGLALLFKLFRTSNVQCLCWLATARIGILCVQHTHTHTHTRHTQAFFCFSIHQLLFWWLPC